MKLYIKYMVSLRCKMMVESELKKLGLKYMILDMGVAEVFDDISPEQLLKLKRNLMKSGLELLDDKKNILIERIKNAIVQMIHYNDELSKINDSEYLSKTLGYNYTYLANIFSEVTGMNIQHFIIIHRIEKAKELLFYKDLNLTEISYRLGYSSVAHLSNQFKKITGLRPSSFKLLKETQRSNLENV